MPVIGDAFGGDSEIPTRIHLDRSIFVSGIAAPVSVQNEKSKTFQRVRIAPFLKAIIFLLPHVSHFFLLHEHLT